MSKKHADALIAKTQEIPAFASKTFLTVAPNGTEAPYMVWHPAAGVNTQDRITGPRITKHPRFTGHIVGQSPEAVLALLDLLEAKLSPGGRGVVLTVTGERSKPVWFESPLPVQVQTEPQPTVVYGVAEVGWSSEPD